MNRRTSVRTLLIITAAVPFFPSCLSDRKKATLKIRDIKAGDNEDALLAAISDTILPGKNTPGAKDVGAHLFALTMIRDCFSPENQDKFMMGLQEFEDLAKKEFNAAFPNCSPAQKTSLLSMMENKKDLPGDITLFYNTIKRFTIQAYTSSEYYLTKVQVYQLVPGKFYGCVPVKKAS